MEVPGVARRTWGYVFKGVEDCVPGTHFAPVDTYGRAGAAHTPWCLDWPCHWLLQSHHRAVALEECAQHWEELRHLRVTLGTAQGDLPYIYLPGIVPNRDINSRFQCSAFFLSPPRPSWQHNYQPQSIIFLIKTLHVKQSHK